MLQAHRRGKPGLDQRSFREAMRKAVGDRTDAEVDLLFMKVLIADWLSMNIPGGWLVVSDCMMIVDWLLDNLGQRSNKLRIMQIENSLIRAY